VHEIAWRHGDVPPPDVLEDFVSKIGDVRAIAVVHNETSNGTTNRFIERYQEIADSIGAVLLVDSVSAFPAEPIRSDMDVIATASQKAFISPPGAAILFISREPRAASGIPPSMDLRRFLEHIQKFETPYTPPINVIYGLDAALDYILNMGIERYHEIHRERANILYKRIKLEPIAREPFRSCTVTAFYTNRAEEIIDSSVLGYESRNLVEAVWERPVLEMYIDLPKHIYLVLDNAGEALVDLVLAEALSRRGHDVTLVVRKESYEIDVLKDDVEAEGIEIIETPGNAPPVLHIDGFLMAKGIANAEACMECEKTRSIHLLRAKCDVLAEMFEVPRNAPIIISGDGIKTIYQKFLRKHSSKHENSTV
jgi:hypothetical protein